MASQNLGPKLDAVVILFVTLSWITVMLRCYVRLKLIKCFSVDDYLILITLVLFTVYGGLVCGGVAWGTGRHMEDLTVHQREKAMQLWYVSEHFYIASTTFLRLSAGYLLLRIAIHPRHRNSIHVFNAINVLCNLGFIFFTIFQCHPVEFWWTRFDGMHTGTCLSRAAANVTYAQSAVSAIIDWAYGILPIFIIWDVHLNTKKKILIGVILSFAALYVKSLFTETWSLSKPQQSEHGYNRPTTLCVYAQSLTRLSLEYGTRSDMEFCRAWNRHHGNLSRYVATSLPIGSRKLQHFE